MIRSLPFAGYFIGLVLPLFVLRDYWAQFSQQAATMVTIGQGVVLASLLLLTVLTRSQIKHKLDYKGLALAAPFVGWCAASTIWSINQASTISNVLLLIFYILALVNIWQMPPKHFREMVLIGACATLAIMAPLPLLLQIRDRTLGGIQPNLLGHFAFLVLILFMLHGRWKIFPALISAIIIYFVQARTVFIGVSIFWLTWIFLTNFIPILKDRITILITSSLPIAIVGIIYVFSEINIIELASSFLNVTSSSRLGSDLTGRAEIWQVAALKIRAKPIEGYGFRTRETADLSYITDAINAHSGIRNIVLDLGYVGFVLFFVWYAYAFWQSIDPRPHPLSKQRIVIASFLVGNLAVLGVEPNYISFAHPTSFLTLFALSFPLVNFEVAEATSPRRQRPRPRSFRPRPRYLRV